MPLDSFYVYGWWFGRIYVDPQNPKHVYQAGVRLQESKDGGQTFANAPGSYHADQHGMAWDTSVPDRVYLGNDGGVYRSDDNGTNWAKFKYLPIGQINTFDVSQQDADRMVVGLQDNGSNLSWSGNGTSNERWLDYTGGDGQRVNIAPDRQNVIYGCYQYGECLVSTNASKGAGSTHDFGNDVRLLAQELDHADRVRPERLAHRLHRRRDHEPLDRRRADLVGRSAPTCPTARAARPTRCSRTTGR